MKENEKKSFLFNLKWFHCQFFLLVYKSNTYNIINQFHAIGLFLYPLKTSGNPGILMFAGGIERDQRHKMG